MARMAAMVVATRADMALTVKARDMAGRTTTRQGPLATTIAAPRVDIIGVEKAADTVTTNITSTCQ